MTMTREEAIYTIERLAHTEAKWPGTEDTLEALDMGLVALRPVIREQVEKAWRGEWIDTRKSSKDVPTCMCSRCTRVVVGLESKFCPDCGSPMTDEAVNMVMERVDQIKCKD